MQTTGCVIGQGLADTANEQIGTTSSIDMEFALLLLSSATQIPLIFLQKFVWKTKNPSHHLPNSNLLADSLFG